MRLKALAFDRGIRQTLLFTVLLLLPAARGGLAEGPKNPVEPTNPYAPPLAPTAPPLAPSSPYGPPVPTFSDPSTASVKPEQPAKPRTHFDEIADVLNEEQDAIAEVVDLVNDWALENKGPKSGSEAVFVLMNESLERTDRFYRMSILVAQQREANQKEVAAALGRVKALEEEVARLKSELKAARPTITEAAPPK